MNNYQQTILSENKSLYDSLPISIKEALGSEQIIDSIVSIGQANDLHIDQIDELVLLTDQVILGVINSNQYIRDIQQGLRVDKARAERVALDVNSKVLSPIRKKIKETAEQNRLDSMEITETSENIINAITDEANSPRRLEVQVIKKEPIPTPLPVRGGAGGEVRESDKLTTPPLAPPPRERGTSETPIHQDNLAGAMRRPQETRTINYENTNPKVTTIPADAKARINADPYKESIE